ncbi:hypothetical protein SAMN05216338_106322 [Bradyrhizobium sp. Rc2d]|uniref:hypothetical protein n=1 Tax=Bradyrhizobium sp. Rc2d TaxID=1855321 RepID=UPI00088C987B|nr:hypothetical protein [Bradyrhizobium sp. Rc2d]SDJ74401.1 hypothetical protein SAMN05216338_106322 [Bradyrhizobium sp. Rc2d]
MAGRRAADWRFPTPKQQRIEDTARKIAEAQRRRVYVDDEDAWWASVLADSRAETNRPAAGRTLAEMRASELKVECLKCFRVVTISREEALRRYDGGSLWKEVTMRLLADGCTSRTGRHEEDGCRPDFR